jgi:molybdopterin converting factor small subunit
MSVQVVLPGFLADLAGGVRHVDVDVGSDGTLAAVLDVLVAHRPTLERRIRDETGALRRFVNVYVDGADVRYEHGLDTAVKDGAVVHVLPSVAGG